MYTRVPDKSAAAQNKNLQNSSSRQKSLVKQPNGTTPGTQDKQQDSKMQQSEKRQSGLQQQDTGSKTVEKTGEQSDSQAEAMKTASAIFLCLALKEYRQIGKDIPKNKELAIKWLTLSAEQGNEYAKFFLDICISSESLRCTRNFKNDESCGRIFENNVPLPDKSAIGFKVDSKLMRKRREKKVGQRYKQDDLEQNISG